MYLVMVNYEDILNIMIAIATDVKVSGPHMKLVIPIFVYYWIITSVDHLPNTVHKKTNGQVVNDGEVGGDVFHLHAKTVLEIL